MNTICLMREIYKSLRQYEENFSRIHDICVNEAIVLSMLRTGPLSAGQLAEQCNMGASHCSKMIRGVEEKELIARRLGNIDKRQMYFELTPLGRESIERITCDSVTVPALLRPLFLHHCNEQ